MLSLWITTLILIEITGGQNLANECVRKAEWRVFFSVLSNINQLTDPVARTGRSDQIFEGGYTLPIESVIP